MTSLLAELASAARAWTWPEFAGVLLAVAYLLLAIRQHIGCWVCAVASTAIYAWLFLEAKLYMESVLNLFYLGMAFYGWWMWTRGGSRENGLPVVRWPLRLHAMALAGILALAVGNGFLLQRFTDAAWPYVDSLTTWAAIWATFLVARKVLENWWYWLAIDGVSVFIYWSRELPLTALLFVVYLVLIPFGMLAWRRSYRQPMAA